MTAPVQILVISLEDAHARRRFMDAQLQAQGMPSYRFINGLNGRSLQADALETVYDSREAQRLAGGPLTPSEIGCAYSHLLAYKEMVNAYLPLALILEDDALLSYQFVDVLRRVLPRLMPDEPRAVLLTHAWRYSAWRSRRIDKVHALYRPYEVYGAHAYLINLAGARAMLETFPRVRTVADDWLSFRRHAGLRIESLVPYLVGKSPYANSSQISGARWSPEPKSQLLRFVRKYLWRKFLFQLLAKPLLQLRRQEATW